MSNPGPFSDLGKAAKEALFKEKLLRDFNTKDQVNFANTSSTGVVRVHFVRSSSSMVFSAELPPVILF